MIMTCKGISKIWASGGSPACLVIPAKVAAENGLKDDEHVIVESVSNGVLIRRLNI
jgi:antitoxin component of MazEF toxin-antitoxin module